MRQFLTWRWWLTAIALVGCLVLLLMTVTRPGESTLASVIEPTAHRVDLVAIAGSIDTEVGWQVRGGTSHGRAEVTLLDGSTYLIADATAGEDECTQIAVENGCMLLADTLGDAVIWFALVDLPPYATEVRLAPIDELLDGVTYARLTNGWELPLLAVVERRCDRETLSLGNFVEIFGDRSYSFLDVASGEISAVQCRKKD